jgi:hypothetical protein
MAVRGNWPAGRRSLAATGHQGRVRRRKQPSVDPELLAAVRRLPVSKNGIPHTWSEAAGRLVPLADEAGDGGAGWRR